MITKTVFFGVMSVHSIDILYPIHNAQELQKARAKSNLTTSVDEGDLRVVCYFENKMHLQEAMRINAEAVQVAMGRNRAVDVPRYSEGHRYE